MVEKDLKKLVLKNEFAHVELSIVSDANGPRLQIKDVLGQTICYLDALQVECLTRMDPNLLDRYLPY